MIAPDDDGRGQLAPLHEVVQRDAEAGTLALSEPADARGQSLKLDALARERDPLAQLSVLRKELQHQLVGPVEVLRVAGQRDPPEGTLAFAEQRPDVLRNETGNPERVLHSGVARDRADVVAVVESDGAAPL